MLCSSGFLKTIFSLGAPDKCSLIWSSLSTAVVLIKSENEDKNIFSRLGDMWIKDT